MHVQAGHDEITCKDVLNLKPKILCEYNGENYTDGATIPKYPVCGFWYVSLKKENCTIVKSCI